MGNNKDFFKKSKNLAHRFLYTLKKDRYIQLQCLTILVMAGLAAVGLAFFTHDTTQLRKESSSVLVHISSDQLKQADTLLVVVKNEPDIVTGKLGNVPLRFFRNQNNKDWISIVGIPIDKKPANYTLVINNFGNEIFKKDITVTKRNFPATTFIIPPTLAQKGYTQKTIVNTIENVENKSLNTVLKTINPKSFISKPFSWPLSHIAVVGNFGDIRTSKNYKIQHLGVDLEAPLQTPVYAVNDGVVVFEKLMPDYGNTLVIDHGLGMYSLYLHLSSFKVKTGRSVMQNDLIGLSGDTGYVVGPHLHFSIKVRGAALDPLKFIKTTQTNW